MKLVQINNKSKNNVSYSTILNSVIGIVLSILVIVFNFVRSGLTSYTYGLESLGLLTIILGILPYLSSSHNGLTSVSFFNLYDSVYGLKKQGYDDINNKIANFRPQYYFFGFIYLTITIIIAFSFPFFFNSNGNIIVENGHNIQWYESSIFILSNAVEIYSVYLVVPIAIILLFINKQSYVYNFINIILTILLNAIIIVLFVLVKNNVINIEFIWMNVIVFALLGSKMLILNICLYPIRKRYFSWYKRKKPSNWRVRKDNVLAVLSQYFNQFSSDIFAILFIIYASLVPHGSEPSLHHGGDGGAAIGGHEFVPSAVFSIFLLLITSSKEIVHCIIDAFIPSMAEHIIKNNNMINKHFFHRYQMLTVFITSFTISTYLLTIAFSNSLFLEANQFSVWLACGLCIPVFIESLSSTYDHLLPIYGSFNKILKLSILKAILMVVLLAIFATSICLTNRGYAVNGLYISIICSWTITAIVIYIISRKLLINHIIHDKCLNIVKQTSLSFIYIFCLFIISIGIFISYQQQINSIVASWAIYIKIPLIIGLAIVNFFINVFNLYLFRKDDVKYYVQELKQAKEINYQSFSIEKIK